MADPSLPDLLAEHQFVPVMVEAWQLKDAVASSILSSNGLRREDIPDCSVARLRDMQDRIEKFLRHPDLIEIPFDDEVRDEIRSALPIKLIDLKQDVLHRRVVIETSELVNSTQARVGGLDDNQARIAIQCTLDRLQSVMSSYAEDSREASKAEEAARLDLSRREDENHRLRIFERRWNVFRTFFARESAATIIGAILLTVMTLALTTGMFAGVPAPPVVSNAFLLILGYFFGNAAVSQRNGP
ncbi:hypothetical protein ACFO1B_35675 [Dactylosporangium siamense]|uniref:Uncharacterized protein n=1 Tax=Dactylosporangium siamense TaxID=685454 RepID=A0A919PJD6_9ACTN|nr:hypothetical protein [Dactylosporangium siamense]GIG45915.1 hypothetical protein Dsi01nite_039560 [Dactylosporangium siamense]